MLRDLRSDLGRIAVNGLLAAENDVEAAFCLLQLFNGRLKGIAGGQGIRAAKGPVADQIRLVASHGQALL